MLMELDSLKSKNKKNGIKSSFITLRNSLIGLYNRRKRNQELSLQDKDSWVKILITHTEFIFFFILIQVLRNLLLIS